jgi:integrase/recombinase XerD
MKPIIEQLQDRKSGAPVIGISGSRPKAKSVQAMTARVTDLLTQGVPLEDVQYLAGHADPRTTRLYDRRPERVTRNMVEKIPM